MSLSASVGVQIPTNVVEVGNEISQNSINALAAASSPATLNPFMTSNAVSATYATKASPTFTGTVTIPAGASITGYLTTSSASATYQTQAGMTNYLTTSAASATYQAISGMSSYLTTTNAANSYASKFDPPTGNYPAVYDVPNDGVEYVRKNQSWVTPTGGGGGGLTISTLSNGATSTLDSTAPTTGQALTFDGTDLVWATVGGGGGGVAWGGITGTVTAQTDLTSYLAGAYYPLSSNPAGYLSAAPTKTVFNAPASYVLTASDANNIVNSGGAVIIPQDSTYSFAIGTVIIVTDSNSGNQIQPEVFGGMTAPNINGSSSGVSIGWGVTCVKVAADQWHVF